MKAHDITNITGTYSKELSDHITEINSAFESGMNLVNFKNLIINIITPATDTPAKRNFLLTLQKQYNTAGVLTLVTNTYLRASGMGADINDRFNK